MNTALDGRHAKKERRRIVDVSAISAIKQRAGLYQVREKWFYYTNALQSSLLERLPLVAFAAAATLASSSPKKSRKLRNRLSHTINTIAEGGS